MHQSPLSSAVRRVEEQELTGDTAIILEMRFDATYLVSLESMRKKSYGWFVDCFFWLDPNVYSTRPAQVDLFLEDAVVRARYADLSAEKSKGKAGASTSKGKAGASTSKGKASDVPPLQDWLLLQADSKAASDLQDRFIHGLCVVDAEAEEAMDLQLKDVLPSGEFYDDFEKFKEAIEEDRE